MTLTISGIASSDLSSFSSYLTCTGATLCNSTVVGNTIQYSVFGKNASTYNITVTKSTALINYTMPNQLKTFTIDQKDLSATWSTSTYNDTDVYDGNTNMVILTINGFQNSEVFISDDFTSSFPINAYDNTTPGSILLKFNVLSVGDYNYLVSEFSDANYNFVSTSYDYSITKS